MPKFDWRGRTASGQQISGTIAAQDKRDALEKLRTGSGVTVASLKQRGDDDDSVPDAPLGAPMARPRMKAGGAVRQVPAPRPFRGLVIALAFVAAAAGVNAVAPIITYRCERESAGPATCTVTRRVLGYPIDRQVLPGAERAEYETRGIPGQVNGRSVEVTITRLVFRNEGGSIRPADWDYPTTGRRLRRSRTPEMLAADFNAFLSDPTQTALSRWHVQTVPMIIVGVLLLLALGTLWLTWIAFTWRRTGQPLQ